MKVFQSVLWVCILGYCSLGCGPFLQGSKKSKNASRPFHIARVDPGLASVSSQSTQPIKMWYGGIANLTTDTLTINKLVYVLNTDMTPDEVRERRPRGTLRYGGSTRTVNLQVSETGNHELVFLNLNARHSGVEGLPYIPKTVDDLENLGPESKVITVDVFFSGKPHKEEGTQVQLVLVQVDTLPQPMGRRLTPEESKPIEWNLPGSPGFSVRWKYPDK